MLIAGIVAARTNADTSLPPGVSRALPAVVKLYGAQVGTAESFGSGVLVSPEGRVVTILSVMLDSPNLRGVAADGVVYQARVIRRDERRQLALLQLDLRGEQSPSLPFLELSHSVDPAPGEWVMAAANPFQVAEGEEPVSVMLGVLSARARLDARRYAQDYPYDGPVLVVDIITSNPGMAGGALLTLDGDWIGLIGRIAQSNLTGTRMNYALPASVVSQFLNEVDEPAQPAVTDSDEAVPVADARPGYHGIKLFELGYRKNLVFVDRVQRDSPAAKAGLRKDDLIVSIDGQTVARARVFHNAMRSRTVGQTVTLVVKRGQRLITVPLTLGEPN